MTDKVDRLTGGVDIYSITRPKLEHHCMYLMQKRVVLEDLIADLQKQIESKDERISKQHKTIIMLRERMEQTQKRYADAMLRMNKEKQDISERMVRLESEVKNSGDNH